MALHAHRSAGASALRPTSLRAAAPSRSRLTVFAKRNEVSQSYARALVDLAFEKKKLDPVHSDIEAVAALLKGNKKLTDLITNPVVEAAQKRAVLSKICKEAKFQAYTTNFLNLLVEKDRLALLEEICESFEEQYCNMTDTQVAVVRSAVQLDKDQLYKIAMKLKELTGSKNVKLTPSIDADLIGGFVVEYGSSQIDLSVKGQVEKVAAELTRAVAVSLA